MRGDIRNEGPDAIGTAVANQDLFSFYFELAKTQVDCDLLQKHLHLSISHITETVRIYSKVFGPNHVRTARAISNRSVVSNILKDFIRDNVTK